MAKRWINSLDVEVGPNGAPLFDMAGCLSFVGGTKTVSSTTTPQALVAASTPCRFIWIGSRVNSDGNPLNTKPCFIGDAATLTVTTGGVCDHYGYGYIEDNSRVYVHGDLQVDSGGTLSIAYYGFMTVEQDGVALIYGTLAAEWDGLIDVYGYLAIHQDGYLLVYSYAQINVYNDIRVSGRMTGGGKIVMLRREGRILDFNDNPIFVLDRAYGFGQTQIA